MQRGRLIRSRLGDDHEHHLGPVFVAVNHRRSEFNFSGDEGDTGRHAVVTAIMTYRDVLADLQLADHRLWHEKADLDILRWKHLDNRASCGNPFAFAIERIEN